MALIPGQFVDYYRPFTPEQLKHLPLNSATAGPPEQGAKLQDYALPPHLRQSGAAENGHKRQNDVDDDDDASSSSGDSSTGSSSGSSSDDEDSSSSSSDSDSDGEEEEGRDSTKVFTRELRRPIGEKAVRGKLEVSSPTAKRGMKRGRLLSLVQKRDELLQRLSQKRAEAVAKVSKKRAQLHKSKPKWSKNIIKYY